MQLSEDGKSGAAFPGGRVQRGSKTDTLNLKNWFSAFKELINAPNKTKKTTKLE